VIALSGKVAFVSGGSSGIGLGIASAFVDAGMKVVITYRSPDRLEEAFECLRRRTGAAVEAIPLDVTDRDAVRHAAEDVASALGKIHVLCNSAGVNQLGPLDEATYDDWDWILGVNLNGVINCLVSFLPHIKAHGEGGHVVNVASMASFIPSVQAGVYAASKFAVRGLTESLRLNLARHGIGVSLVCPGLTRSNIWQAPLRRSQRFARAAPPASEQRLKELRDVHSVGMDPAEVGRKTLDGIRRNDLYVFSHPEFRDELSELHDEIIAAIPVDEVDVRRLSIENARRAAKSQAQHLARRPPDAPRQDPDVSHRGS
jgi:NAD(P)-dependent dehydrogenase (short-subunit alcohol dehydrogenase family)